MPLREAFADKAPLVLPASGWAALRRGIAGRCPRCGRGPLFRRYLKPAECCGNCGQDWSHQRADDFPAYIAIFLTGHIVVPLVAGLMLGSNLSEFALLAIIIPVAIALMLAFLHPAKGAVIAMQWWLGLHGFDRER